MAFEQVAPSAPMILHTNRGADAVSFLPPKAADRLRALRQHVHDLHAVVPVSDARLATTAARLEAEKALSRLRAHPHLGGFGLGPGDARVVAAHEQLDKLSTEAQRINTLFELRSTAWRTASNVLSTVEGYLRDGPGPLRDLETPEPKLAKNETLLDAIERNRRRVRELAADLHRVHSAPYPSAHVKQRLRQQVEELAVRGAPSVSRLIEHDGPVEFATTQLRAKVHNSEPAAVAITEMPDTVAMFAWLHRDLLIKRLDGLIADESDDAAALTPEARAKATTEIQGDLLAVERDESALVWQAQAQGLPVEHRSDIDPRALLGVVLVAPSGSRGTSPERVLTIAGAR